MAKAALIIGINEYEDFTHLYGCESDAKALEKLLRENHDETPNFQFRTLLSSDVRITKAELRAQTDEIFSKKGVDVALFYFAGHGTVTKAGAFLVSQDGAEDDEGLSMTELITKANGSPATEKIIILDCCYAGEIDRIFASTNTIPLASGVSILAACRATELSEERDRRGLFTSKLCDALEGGAADVRGFVNMAGCYTYLDEVLFSVWDQQPVYKANVEKLVSLRRTEPAVSDDKLRKLSTYFPDENYVFPLDPSFEPTAKPNHPENEAIFADLQRFRGARLVVPNENEHMYYAAMLSLSCQLTPLGKFYWHKAAKGGL